jgi:hypothetical protein
VFGLGSAYGSGLETELDAPNAYGRDAGAGGSLGTRVVYKEKISDNLELAAIYAWAGALAPVAHEVNQTAELGDMLRMRARHSVAGKISAKVPLTKTQVTMGYKWLNGPALSRQDLFGEAALGIDPYLSVSIRQPLPSFGTSGHWEVLADFRNVLSQGCLTVDGDQGFITLVPVVRSIRGGVSFQF